MLQDMHPMIRNVLGIAGVVALLVGSYGAMSVARSYERVIDPASVRSFMVTGEGKAVVIPDIAEFTFSVVSEGGTDIATLRNENINKTNSAIAFVKSRGVDAKDVKTQSFSLEPRYQYYTCARAISTRDPSACPPAEIVGYTVRQMVLVRARDLNKVGELLSGVIQNGANTVSGLNFTVDDRTTAEKEARTEAMRKAEEKAKAIAEAGRFHVGRLLNIDEGPLPMYAYRDYAYEQSGIGGGAAPAPSIEPGSTDVIIQVTLRYEIE